MHVEEDAEKDMAVRWAVVTTVTVTTTRTTLVQEPVAPAKNAEEGMGEGVGGDVDGDATAAAGIAVQPATATSAWTEMMTARARLPVTLHQTPSPSQQTQSRKWKSGVSKEAKSGIRVCVSFLMASNLSQSCADSCPCCVCVGCEASDCIEDEGDLYCCYSCNVVMHVECAQRRAEHLVNGEFLCGVCYSEYEDKRPAEDE